MSRLLLCGPARRGIQPAPAPVLGTITDLSATAGVESAVLAWTPAANATSHQPQYSDDGETWTNFGSALSGSADGITVTGLTAGVEYSFRVVASDGSTQTISNVDTATPQAAPEWASGQWELTIDGQPGALDFDAGTVTLPVFGTLAMTAEVSSESATISYTVPGVGPGSMSLTHSDGSLSGTAAAGGSTVPVTGQRPPVPGQLSAGTIVALPGDEQVTISEGAAPSGGTGGPYTSALYRSTTSGQKGSLIVPSLALPHTDTGLTNGTTYYYTREVSDGANTADTPQIIAVPQEPSAVQPIFSDSFESGDASHTEGGFSWNSGGSRVITTHPRTGDYSMWFPFGPTEPDGSSHWWTETRYTHGPVQEIWMEWYLWIPPNFVHPRPSASNNNKLWAWWGPNGYSQPGMGMYQFWSTNNEQESTVNCARYGPSSTFAEYVGGSAPFILTSMKGTWAQIRGQIRLSDMGQSNGIQRLWVNGVLRINVTNDNNNANTAGANVLTSGYLMGYDNSGYPEQMDFYVDDVKFYTSDPGWT